MTTSVKVKSANYPVLVRTTDRGANNYEFSSDEILWPEDGERTFYCTTTRTITAMDIDYSHPRAKEDREKRYPKAES